MGAKLVPTHAPAINTAVDLVPIILSMRRGEVLFIEEIHALNNQRCKEMLCRAMQEHRMEEVFGNNYPQTLRIPLPPFTLIGATAKSWEVDRTFPTKSLLLEQRNSSYAATG